MNKHYFDIYQQGMSAQLKELDLDEMVLYIRNYLHNFLLDTTVCGCFIERLVNDPQCTHRPEHHKCLVYLLDKALQLRPFWLEVLDIALKLTGNEPLKGRLQIVNALNESKETYDLITSLDLKYNADDVRKFLPELIHVHKTHIAAAQYALHVDNSFGNPPGPWIKDFKCPASLKPDWDISLFNHYAGLSLWDKAMELWPTLDNSRMRETTFNLAAAMFAAKGDTPQALALYAKSIEMDPRQTPIRLRMKELESPFVPNHSLVDDKRVAICLYSWNKADLLRMTLNSLSRSTIGPARIHILLNGCTDNSRQVVAEAQQLFPNNEFTVHELHVNIGAPAARNWLMTLPEVHDSDYIAFLDDDVIIQQDWLAQFLTLAEADPKVAVVGCKVVGPGSPRPFQYLFRYVALASHGLFKMSLHAPLSTFDTGTYDFIRETRNVMGCQHLLRTSAMDAVPAGFDIRFSPSQVDDIEHDVALCLAGYKVMYCGTVTCEHHQSSGVTTRFQQFEPNRTGNAMGNDIKFFFKYFASLPSVEKLDNLSMDIGVEPPEI